MAKECLVKSSLLWRSDKSGIGGGISAFRWSGDIMVARLVGVESCSIIFGLVSGASRQALAWLLSSGATNLRLRGAQTAFLLPTFRLLGVLKTSAVEASWSNWGKNGNASFLLVGAKASDLLFICMVLIVDLALASMKFGFEYKLYPAGSDSRLANHLCSFPAPTSAQPPFSRFLSPSADSYWCSRDTERSPKFRIEPKNMLWYRRIIGTEGPYYLTSFFRTLLRVQVVAVRSTRSTLFKLSAIQHRDVWLSREQSCWCWWQQAVNNRVLASFIALFSIILIGRAAMASAHSSTRWRPCAGKLGCDVLSTHYSN
mgnify:CR=1 FL=1